MPAGNKRIRRPSRSARELIAETSPAPAPRTSQDLAREIHRVELQIAATRRMEFESKLRRGDSLPPPDHSRGRAMRPVGLTHVQARRERGRVFLQAAMFVTTLILLAGAGAGIYKMWLAAHGR